MRSVSIVSKPSQGVAIEKGSVAEDGRGERLVWQNVKISVMLSQECGALSIFHREITLKRVQFGELAEPHLCYGLCFFCDRLEKGK